MKSAARSLTDIAKHTLPAPKSLVRFDVVLDIGAGIRPMPWYAPPRHICIDPHEPYVRVLREAGYDAYAMTAMEALRSFVVDQVVMLDVIEHMDKDSGEKVVALAVESATQVVIYTPFGFVEQTEDAWNMGGEFWQTHRSGWTPDDFPGWEIQPFRQEGFFAVWTRNTAS